MHLSAVSLDRLPAAGVDASAQICALEDALTALAQIDPRRAQVIELRFFGGLTVEMTGEVLQISPQSVMRDWKLARAWLARELAGEPARPQSDCILPWVRAGSNPASSRLRAPDLMWGRIGPIM